MLLKFPTFCYNNVNRASKTEAEKPCHSSFLFFLPLEKTVKNPIH